MTGNVWSWVLVALIAASTLSACGGTGACHGYSPTFDEDYCYDDWTEDECDEWDVEQVNAAAWNFHAGQSCAERGV